MELTKILINAKVLPMIYIYHFYAACQKVKGPRWLNSEGPMHIKLMETNQIKMWRIIV